jgi:NADH-quinone oxidoreductase subunit L
MAAGSLTAWFLYLKRPDLPGKLATKLSGIYNLLDRKYYFDDLYIRGFAAGGRRIGQFLWKNGDERMIDGVLVNGTANTVGRLAGVLRQLQTGYLYHYAFAMFIGMTLFLGWMLWA